jgi:hypothetical protein
MRAIILVEYFALSAADRKERCRTIKVLGKFYITFFFFIREIALMMLKAASTSETSETFYQTTWQKKKTLRRPSSNSRVQSLCSYDKDICFI